MLSNGRAQRFGAALLPVLFASAVAAQYDLRPFEDDPVAVSAAFGAEMAVLRLEAAEALLAAGVAHEVEEVLEGLEVEFKRFGAALREAEPTLLAPIEEAFEATLESDDRAAAVTEALSTAREVRDAVSAPLIAEPAYAAAVMSLLLVSETGVAEGWEEAVEGEVGPYAIGWAGIHRLYELWAMIKSQASDNQVFEIEDQLGVLQELFQSPTPPNMEGADPEEGEGAAVHVTGFLEDVSGAWLFPDRDLAGLLVNTRDVASQACQAYRAGDTLTGDANLVWVAFAFGEYLAGTLGLFAPEPTAELEELLEGVAGSEEEEDGEENADVDEAEADAVGEGAGFDPEASCEPLLTALEEAGAPLGL